MSFWAGDREEEPPVIQRRFGFVQGLFKGLSQTWIRDCR